MAHVLSEASGRNIGMQDLWQGRARMSQLWQPAFTGLPTTWDYAATEEVIADWVRQSASVLDFDHRRFLSTWGTPLTDRSWAYVESLANPLPVASTRTASSRRGRTVTPAQVAIWRTLIEQLRYLDDQEGGNQENLRFAHHYLLTLGQHLTAGDTCNADVHGELLQLWMYLCQIAGWMAYDAEQHGLAQRYFYSGLHVARSTEDTTYGAYLLGLLTHQAIYRERPREATDLANAASEAATTSPLAVRALVNTLLAHAQALAGNAHGFHSIIDTARSMMETSEAVETRPAWLYWFDMAELRARQGHGLLALAHASSRRDQHHWLVTADELLTPKSSISDSSYPREAVYNRIWLAQSQLWRGELNTARDTIRETRAAHAVRSPRSTALLRRVDPDFRT
jgi:hypothetical protein